MRFLPFLLRALLAALASAMPARALDYVVDDFRNDFSGDPADTAKLDGGFGDTLKIAPRLFQYTAITPYNLTDSIGVNGQAGTTPNVVAVQNNHFKVGYVGWAQGHQAKFADDMNYPRSNILTRSVYVDEGAINMTGGSRIAGQENIPDPFTPAIQGTNRSPTYFNFAADGGRYAAYWGSMDPGAYIRHTTSTIAALGGSPDTWGRYVYVTPPNDPVNVAGYGEISAVAIPGTGGRRTVLAYETNIQVGNYRFEIRREDIVAGTYTVQTVIRPAMYAEDFSIAADSSGRVLVLFRENNALYAVWHDGPTSPQVGPLLIDANVSIGDGVTFHYYRPYAAANLVNGRFVIAYTKAGKIWRQELNLIDQGPGWDITTQVASPPVQISLNGETCNFPSIAVNHDKLLIGWFKRIVPQQDSLVGILYPRQGATIVDTLKKKMPLTSEIISFSQVGSGWYKCCHYFRAPSLALDSNGSVAAAYDNQFWAKLAMTSHFAIFYDSATFVSRPISFTSLPAVLPVDAAQDSIEYVSYQVKVKAPAGGGPAKSDLKLAVSPTGTVGAGTPFQPFPAGLKTTPGAFKYQLTVNAQGPLNTSQTKVDSLILKYNVQPRRPTLDSIRIGTAPQEAYDPLKPYTVLPRKDTVRLVLGGVDLDDGPPIKFYLYAGNKLVDSAVSSRTSAANYKTVLSLKPPDSLPDPLPLTIRTKDSTGWVSLPLDFRPEFRNRAPAETVTVARNRGRDSSGVYRPTGGPLDTLAPSAGQTVVLQAGDTAQARIRLGDLNDDSVTFTLRRNGVVLFTRKVPVAAPLVIPLAADTLPPPVDTILATVADKDTTLNFRFLVRPNRPPDVDTLVVARFKARDSTTRAGPFDKAAAGDTGLIVPAGLPTVLRAGVDDADKPQGDGVAVKWTVYSPKAGCAQGDLACYDKSLEVTGDSLQHAFGLGEEYLVMRATDSTGAFSERRLRLEYPMADTAGNASFAAALKALQDSLAFVLGSDRTSDTLKAELSSTGNVPLRITGVATGKDDRDWLGLKLQWDVPGNPPGKDSLSFTGRTDSNAVKPGNPITVPPGTKLNLTFEVDSDSLRGDSLLIDTVFLTTNDPANPIIRIPIRMAFSDLPVLRISHRGGAPGPSGGYNDEGLPVRLPVRSQLVFAFSETVIIANPEARIQVYSYLDSLKNPAGWRPIPGTFTHRRRALPKGFVGKVTAADVRAATSNGGTGASLALGVLGPNGLAVGKAAAGASADSLADTLVFRPAYDRPSDSLKVQPAPGFFVHRDILHISVDNAVTDRSGNALDLRLNKKALSPGVLDTVWSVRVDDGVFRVASTLPVAGEVGWHPEKTIRVRFNRKLGLPPPQGGDSLTALDLEEPRGDSNYGVWVRSAARGQRRYDLQLLGVEDGDSTLVFRPKPRLAHFDTVTVTLSGALTDENGLTLDGDRNGFPSRFYNPTDTADTTDSYSFTFYTRFEEFYVYPNPFRHSDPRHREKGAVTFKNVNALTGFQAGKALALRIHSVSGDLVYSSKSVSRPLAAAGASWASMDWDLRNNQGNLAGTGVYVYTLVLGDRVLKKGKIAVLR